MEFVVCMFFYEPNSINAVTLRCLPVWQAGVAPSGLISFPGFFVKHVKQS
jgi:hypothetical protein